MSIICIILQDTASIFWIKALQYLLTSSFWLLFWIVLVSISDLKSILSVYSIITNLLFRLLNIISILEWARWVVWNRNHFLSRFLMYTLDSLHWWTNVLSRIIIILWIDIFNFIWINSIRLFRKLLNMCKLWLYDIMLWCPSSITFTELKSLSLRVLPFTLVFSHKYSYFVDLEIVLSSRFKIILASLKLFMNSNVNNDSE